MIVCLLKFYCAKAWEGRVYAAFILLLVSSGASAQSFIPLWPEGQMPNSKGMQLKHVEELERITRVKTPGIYTFLASAENNNGSAVLVCPSGGYHHLTYVLGGFDIAKWLNTLGINAFVLIYRLPTEQDLVERHLGPIQDAQRAMKLIRASADEWNLDKDRLGVFGTSAGGHLASTLGVHSDDFSRVGDAYDDIPFSPDLIVLISPVISMTEHAHSGSVNNLLGKEPPTELMRYFSNELHISSETPPAFLVHAQDDESVSYMNSVLFYKALVDHGISGSLHIFPEGGHSIDLRKGRGETGLWTQICEAWLRDNGFIKPD